MTAFDFDSLTEQDLQALADRNITLPLTYTEFEALFAASLSVYVGG